MLFFLKLKYLTSLEILTLVLFTGVMAPSHEESIVKLIFEKFLHRIVSSAKTHCLSVDYRGSLCILATFSR